MPPVAPARLWRFYEVLEAGENGLPKKVCRTQMCPVRHSCALALKCKLCKWGNSGGSGVAANPTRCRIHLERHHNRQWRLAEAIGEDEACPDLEAVSSDDECEPSPGPTTSGCSQASSSVASSDSSMPPPKRLKQSTLHKYGDPPSRSGKRSWRTRGCRYGG